ncbi:hypothetical protein AGR7A_Lc140046 [Agrobacterium deltaense NCPPB 1641]|uniref:Uncharacterized protein n=1 Tax=Agrobacterium deltaense NCPPB 1641 TaxID=1183425 RepID=A0A1S7U2H7_9HYPH|nr:hypothetical protein AGR7A_Lc140046 [Agrobacterium deltaense NCPPB 1641]
MNIAGQSINLGYQERCAGLFGVGKGFGNNWPIILTTGFYLGKFSNDIRRIGKGFNQ